TFVFSSILRLHLDVNAKMRDLLQKSVNSETVTENVTFELFHKGGHLSLLSRGFVNLRVGISAFTFASSGVDPQCQKRQRLSVTLRAFGKAARRSREKKENSTAGVRFGLMAPTLSNPSESVRNADNSKEPKQRLSFPSPECPGNRRRYRRPDL